MSLEVLHSTIDDDAKDVSLVDIVAVHGLAEDANETWTHTYTGINWLKDFLPSAAKGALKARIFCYAYKADVSILFGNDAPNSILQQAHTLVSRLQAERNLSDTSNRPLIFICHGFGGIIVKRALAFSATQVSSKVTHNYSIYISTYGVIFLGTPHNGLESAGLQLLALVQYGHDELALAMKRHHEVLQDISDQFAPLAKQFHLFFFWEQLKTKFRHKYSYIVRADSAAPLLDDTERSGIWANHSQMCKYSSPGSSEYKSILDALLRYSRAARGSIAGRWQNAERYLATQRSIEASELVGFDVHKNNRPFLYVNSAKSPELGMRRVRNKYFHVPHNVSNIFTGQGRLFAELEQKMLMPPAPGTAIHKRIFVLYGLGGSGKTQFCLKFIQDHRDNYWAIFWVDASSIETAERTLSHIGKVGGLGENHQAGMYWLTGLDMPWMLVIDNADDPSIDYSRFFPSGDKGNILLTSRLQDCKIHATIGHHEFRNMEEEDAITLLLKAAGEDVNATNARKAARPIAQALGYLPLALTQAGASIRQNVCALVDYLDVYNSHKSELSRRHLAQGSDSYQHSIYTTWEVTVRRIESEDSENAVDAIQIIQILAFLHFEQVPISMFKRAFENIQQWPEAMPPLPMASRILEKCCHLPGFAETVQKLFPAWFKCRQRRLPSLFLRPNDSWDPFRFRQALVVLVNHSLIYRDSGEEETYSMHPMVHSWARDRLDWPDQLLWSDLATNTLAASIRPDLDAAQQPYRLALIPHITASLKGKALKSNAESMQSEYRISKSIKFAGVYSEGGNWTEASLLQKGVIKQRRSSGGSTSAETLDVMVALAASYWNLDRVKESLQLLSEAVELSTSTFGERNSRTLRAMDKLSGTLWLCGRRGEAEKLSRAAVSGLQELLSPDHPHTLDAMDTLGRTLLHLGRANEAEQLHKDVLDSREKLLGPSHPDTLMAMANLGMSCFALKDLDRAEELLDIVFHERSRVLGEEHAYTLWAINDLSKIRCAQGRPLEAEDMLTSILATVIRTLGEEHIGMSMTKFNLVRCYVAQERWLDARRLLLETIRVQKMKMPDQHPDRIVSTSMLAKITKHLGDLHGAEIMLKDVVDVSTKVHGSDDIRTRRAMGQLAAVYIAQGRFEEADLMDANLREGTDMFYLWLNG